MRFLTKTDLELQVISKFLQQLVELGSNVNSCDQAVKIEIIFTNLKNWPKYGNF